MKDQVFGHTNEVNELLDILEELGVSEHTILQHFLDFFTADDLCEALEDLRLEVTDDFIDDEY